MSDLFISEYLLSQNGTDLAVTIQPVFLVSQSFVVILGNFFDVEILNFFPKIPVS